VDFLPVRSGGTVRVLPADWIEQDSLDQNGPVSEAGTESVNGRAGLG
jgi:hypothetical protein